MTWNGWLQITAFFLLILACAKPLGIYMAAVMEGRRTWLSGILGPCERLIYRLCGVTAESEQRWTQYAASLLAFSAVSGLFLYFLQRAQGLSAAQPAAICRQRRRRTWRSTPRVSFVTNTNWQSYTPEATMSYFTQMAGLAMHNFFSAAAGMAVAIALVRGFARRSAETLGNFWVDFTRATLYILLPIWPWSPRCCSCSQGVIQNLNPYTEVTTLEGAEQTIAQGPVASQEAIKMLGTNGGGFFNANSAHPFENPTPLSNFLQMFFIFLIPGGADLHLRQDGERHAAGLGVVRRR